MEIYKTNSQFAKDITLNEISKTFNEEMKPKSCPLSVLSIGFLHIFKNC